MHESAECFSVIFHKFIFTTHKEKLYFLFHFFPRPSDTKMDERKRKALKEKKWKCLLNKRKWKVTKKTFVCAIQEEIYCFIISIKSIAFNSIRNCIYAFVIFNTTYIHTCKAMDGEFKFSLNIWEILSKTEKEMKIIWIIST